MYKSILICLTLYVTYASAANYTCYVCSSAETGCGGTFDSTASFTQTSGCEYCGKYYGAVGGYNGYTRTCLQTCTVSNIDFWGIVSWQKCCQGDLCNAASSVSFNILLSSVLLLIVYALRR